MQKSKLFIGIAGIIAAGKSTLTKNLSELLGYKAYYEPVEGNPYLEDFYQDMKRWSAIMQLHLLHARYGAHKTILKGLEAEEGAVQDRTLYEDQIFANLLHKAGLMTDREMETYRTSLANMTCGLGYPDVIVYLQVDPKVALHRIKDLRKRKAESGITLDYLQGLNEGYEQFVSEVSSRTTVLSFDWNNYGSTQEVVDRITNKISRVSKRTREI